jgi:hypothetical protein
MPRDDWHKENAIVDLLANLAVPRIPAAQLAVVEPGLDARGSQRVTDAFCRPSLSLYGARMP